MGGRRGNLQPKTSTTCLWKVSVGSDLTIAVHVALII